MTTIHILIAEDSKFNQIIIEKIMRDLKYEFLIVGNGKLAVDESLKKKYDLIFMDIEMPVLNGFGAIKLIRSDQYNPNQKTKIVGFTNHHTAQILNELSKHDVDELISKPFSKEEIKEICEKQKQQTPEKKSGMKKNNTLKENNDIAYDLSYLREFTHGDEQFFKEMLTYFVQNTPKVMLKLDVAFHDRKWEELRQIAHKYGSEIAFVGIKGIASKLDELEGYNYKKNKIQKANDLIQSIKKDCHLVTEKLKTDFNL